MMPKGGLNGMMKQFGKMQEKLEKVQEELKDITVEGTAGGGMITVKANGQQEILAVNIDPEILQDDVEMVEDMIVAATNQALSNAAEAKKEKMSDATGGLLSKLPGGMNIPGL
ncbi:MAG: YbaB/EbfC family nucleoid-associated protein [Candidatus Marinimicrobia bacterium]|nr:YbaB/EbfC family nucleoid-associated protein [Candidatus Neomarinimicrobiota bacterium]